MTTIALIVVTVAMALLIVEILALRKAWNIAERDIRAALYRRYK